MRLQDINFNDGISVPKSDQSWLLMVIDIGIGRIINFISDYDAVVSLLYNIVMCICVNLFIIWLVWVITIHTECVQLRARNDKLKAQIAELQRAK